MLAVAERAAENGVLETEDAEQVRLLGHAQHVADCLERFRVVVDRDRVVGRLRKSLDRIASPASKALDSLLEIEIAGRLAELGFEVVTMEPDVFGTSPAGNLTCACKHPDTMDGTGARIMEAAKQIAKQEHPGVVVVSLDSVFHQPGRFLGVAHPAEANRWLTDQLERAARECADAIQDALARDPKIAGIILLLSVPYVSAGPPRTLGFRKGSKFIPNRGGEVISSVLAKAFLI